MLPYQSLSLSLSLSLLISSHKFKILVLFYPLLPLQEVHEARIEMQRRTNEWYQGVRAVSSEEELEEETSHTMLKMDDNLIRERRTASSGSSSNSSLDGRTASPTHIQLA